MITLEGHCPSPTPPTACLSQLESCASLSYDLPLARLQGREGQHKLLVHGDQVVGGVRRQRVLEARGYGEAVRLRWVEEDGQDAARLRVGVKRGLEALHLVKRRAGHAGGRRGRSYAGVQRGARLRLT
eukprot:scaffold29337_cov63-Phaeocystis_antarctica.AAC.3